MADNTQARFGGRFFPGVGRGDDMSKEQFTAVVIWLVVATAVTTAAAVVTKTAAVTAVTVPSVSLLYVLAWDLWRYATEKGSTNE